MPIYSTTDLTRTGLGSNLDLGGERLAISNPEPHHGVLDAEEYLDNTGKFSSCLTVNTNVLNYKCQSVNAA